MPKAISARPQTVDALLKANKAFYYQFLSGGRIALRKNGWWILYAWTSKGPAGYAKTGALRRLPRE